MTAAPEKSSIAESALRTLWTSRGIPVDQQDEWIADIYAKAQPGARIGPFTLGAKTTIRTRHF